MLSTCALAARRARAFAPRRRANLASRSLRASFYCCAMRRVFASAAEHAAWLSSQCALPAGFSVGATSLTFAPAELPGATARMGLSLISLDAPTTAWAALFTRNAAPGAPVRIGRARLAAGAPLQVRGALRGAEGGLPPSSTRA